MFIIYGGGRGARMLCYWCCVSVGTNTGASVSDGVGVIMIWIGIWIGVVF